jgi:predicted enzyme related to lactoylglutathione lyase
MSAKARWLVINLADTMVGAADVEKIAKYYEQLMGMERLKEGDGSFVVLKDRKTSQRICVIPDPQQRPCPGLETEDFDGALTRITSLGGKVVKKESHPKMDLACCEDPAGNGFMIWRSK